MHAKINILICVIKAGIAYQSNSMQIINILIIVIKAWIAYIIDACY